MEQIYTIPVNEAFDASAADKGCGCPMCALYRRLEENELELILGASMMEPDVRIQTNKEGFCRTHYDMMFVRKNRLGMALTLESHLKELADDLAPQKGLGALIGKETPRQMKRVDALEHSCYVCRRIDYHFQHMAETVVLLYETDENFRKKLNAQPYFCLPHYRLLLEKADVRLGKKQLPEFTAEIGEVVRNYLAELTEDISWFCKKFDYRYDAEPWKNSKDSVERAIKFLRADLHGAPDKR